MIKKKKMREKLLYWTRAKNDPPPSNDHQDIAYRRFKGKTLSYKLFLFKNTARTVLSFSLRNKLLGECRNVLADAAFKTSPSPIKQLNVLFGNSDREVPLVFGLLRGKRSHLPKKADLPTQLSASLPISRVALSVLYKRIILTDNITDVVLV